MHTLIVSLLLAVFSVSSCYARLHINLHRKSPEHVHCFSEQELEESSEKVVEHFVGHRMDWARYSSVSLVQQLEDAEKRRKRRKRTPQASCPNYETISKGVSVSERSISPWTYSINVDENRYPQKLAFAHCLCHHCINTYTGKENNSLNSVKISQSMLVLRKETCPRDKKKFTFRMEYLSVPVACTCALPKYQ